MQTLEISFCRISRLQDNQFNTGTKNYSSSAFAWRSDKVAVETLGRSDQLHSVLNRFGIEAIPESLRVRMGDHEDQIEFRVASVGQDKDPYCRALLRRRGIIEVEKLSIVVACLPFHNSDASEEDGLQCSDDSVQKLDDNLDVALSHVINQLLNDLACE